jgi:hypothetical protein
MKTTFLILLLSTVSMAAFAEETKLTDVSCRVQTSSDYDAFGKPSEFYFLGGQEEIWGEKNIINEGQFAYIHISSFNKQPTKAQPGTLRINFRLRYPDNSLFSSSYNMALPSDKAIEISSTFPNLDQKTSRTYRIICQKKSK